MVEDEEDEEDDLVEVEEDEDEDEEDPPIGFGPAMAVVIGASSTKIPDQYQSSAAGVCELVAAFTSLSTPMWKSSEFEDALTLIPDKTSVSGAEPLEAQRPTTPLVKSMSYAKLYQLPGTSWVPH